MLVGRREELRILQEAEGDDKSHFIAVYGRRRIGKTFLVRETFGSRFTFQHAGVSKGTLKEQLFSFDASLKEAGYVSKKASKNWAEAFEKLKDLIRESKDKRKIVFIDELSWMDTPKSDLMKSLENFWNGWASARKDIILIICASATSWMLSKVIHNKGGLYNRLTDKIHLKSFSLLECEELLKTQNINFNRAQILECYMIFGGIPYYWGFLRQGLSLTQNIDHLLFAEEAPLKDEFDFLYAAIFNHPEVYLDIVRVLGEKKAGMTREEIISAAGIPNSGDLTKKLQELESCGFIRKYTSFGKKKKNTVYQLIDNFTLFYYQFMKSEPTDDHFWTNQINTPRVNTWKGLAFERVCLQHTDNIKKKLGISGVLTEIHSWLCLPDPEKGLFGSQIDLLIVRKDQVINICEMKNAGSEYTLTAAQEKRIQNQIHDLLTETGTKYAIHPTLVTTYGLVRNSHSGIFQSVLTLDDLF